MIDATEIDMYPAFLMQDVIDIATREFIPRFLAFSNSHTEMLVHLMKVQNNYMYGQEENVKPIWEKMENRKVSPQVRF